MKTDLCKKFETEIWNFRTLSFLNLVFAAITMAFGILFIVTRLEGIVGNRALSPFQIVIVVVGFAAVGLGMQWMRSSARIFRDVREIQSAYDSLGGNAVEEDVTGFIIQMLAQYRENKATIQTMILVCTLGGFCFLGIGIMNGLQFVSGLSSFEIRIDYVLILSALIALAIALISLLNSFYFRRYTSVWDARLDGLSRSEEALEEIMGPDRR